MQIHNELKEAKRKNDAMQKQQQRISIDLVSVLGIFSGIIMAFLGGFQLFQISVANLTKQNDFKVLFCVCLVAFVFFNSFMLLIHLVAEFGNYSLFSMESRDSFVDNGFWRTIKNRYKFIFMVDCVLVLLILVFGALYIGDVIDISQYWKFIPKIHSSNY